jgi:hypothetical protein
MTLTICSVTAMILAMLAVPLATHAQPSGKVPRIGFLTWGGVSEGGLYLRRGVATSRLRVGAQTGWQIFASTYHIGT